MKRQPHSIFAALGLVGFLASSVLSTDLNGDLVKAAKDLKLDKVRELLTKGADPNARDKAGLPAVTLAFDHCLQGRRQSVCDRAREIVVALFEAGAKLERPTEKTANYRLARFGTVWAVEHDRMEVVAAIGVTLDANNDDGRDAVARIIRSKSPDAAALKRLLSHKAPVGTSLVTAIESGNFEIATLLIETGADVNVARGASVIARFDEGPVSEGRTGNWKSSLEWVEGVGPDPLMAAIAKRNVALVQTLLERGADARRMSIVSNAVQINGMPADDVTIMISPVMAQLAATTVNPATGAEVQMTSSMMRKSTVKDLRPTKEATSTPLCRAKALNQPDIVSLLLKHGAIDDCAVK